MVPAVHRRFPRLELLLVEEKTDVLLAQLREGEIDAAVLALPIGDEQLHVEPLFTEDFVLAVPAGHELADRERVSSEVLVGADVLLLTDGHCLRDQALEVCALVGATERRGFRATSLETLRQMVAAGVGVTLLPKLSVSPPVPENSAVRTIAFEEPAPSRHIALFWRRSSVHAELLTQLAGVMSDLAPELLHS